jgi:hypothetical protein
VSVGIFLFLTYYLQQFRALGVSATQTRTAASRQLVLQAPAPVVARALGYSPGTATQHVIAAGGTWNRYPATRAEDLLRRSQIRQCTG